jgi:hypothetical protein
MCVILVCPDETKRPDRAVLDACHAANPHGAGVAWREGGRVRWMKNLEPDDLEALLPELPGEVVIHFRWASVGGVDADLCHPFPVTRKAETDLFGSAKAVVFQNGTWGAYDEALRRLTNGQGRKLPDGPMSDTRAAALCVRVHGREMLAKLPGRWVWMDGERTRLYGSWLSFRGMRASNLHFVRRLEPVEAEEADEPDEAEELESWSDDPLLLRQPDLWSCERDQHRGGFPSACTARVFS